ETSGGAELIAAALQDHGRASVAGRRTRGKASIQNTLVIPGTDANLKLTTGSFLRPSRQNLHRFPESKPSDPWGVRPDAELECRVRPGLGRRLKGGWLLQSLGPGEDKEILPLDDPANDPTRQAALQALRDKVGGQE